MSKQSSVSVSTKLIGDRALRRKLDQLDGRTRGQAMKAAMKVAMEPVRDLAKHRAPVLTGRLRDSIKIATFRKRGISGAVVQTGTRRQLKIAPGDNYYYPAAHEYGSSRMPMKSFLRSALADRKNIALSRLSGAIKAFLERK